MHILGRILRILASRVPLALVVGAFLARLARSWSRRHAGISERRARARSVLPSVYDRYPEAGRAPRRRIGLQSVPLERITGTMRHPSQNTADFLPLPRLRGENWRGRWQRLSRAMDRLMTLPPVDLVQVGDDYFVADGHNRVAAAMHAGGVEIDADVTQLVLPGVATSGQARLDAASVLDEGQLRRAGQGRHSRTVATPLAEESISRRDLLRPDDEPPR